MRTKFCTPLTTSLLFISLGFSLTASTAQAQSEAVQERGQLLGAGLDPGDELGSSVSISGNTNVVGAPFDSDTLSLAGAAFVFVETSTGWIEEAKLSAGDLEAFNTFGEAVSISGDTILVGASGNSERGSFAGAAYVFTRSAGVWTQEAKLLAADGAPNDLFGISVAIDGDTAVVGSWLDDDAGTSSGSAYVFVRNGTSWSQQAKLVASDAMDRDNFGEAVAIDGDTIAIGARHNDDDGLSSGSAYAFFRSGTQWIEQAKLLADDGGSFDTFGCSVAVSGESVLVGACLEDAGGINAGAAYAFLRNGTSWSQQAKLLASDGSGSDLFGASVAFDGEMALVGASFQDGAVGDEGAVYVFRRASGFFWNEIFKLSASDASPGDGFGGSVSLSGDRFCMGAAGHDQDPLGAIDTGAAYASQLGAAASQVSRIEGSNPDSFSATDPVLGSNLQFTVDLGLTGHTSAGIFVYSAEASIPLSGGRVILVGGVRLFSLPLQSGSLVNFNVPVPSDIALLGATIHAQALHIFGTQPFELSNAIDLTAGF